MAEPAPVEVRLRMALKCLLRSFGLRCVQPVEELPGDGPRDTKALDGPSEEKSARQRPT
jgi:hypothetical protein